MTDDNEKIRKEEERLMRTMSKSQSSKRVSQTILTKATNPEVTARANKFLKDEEIDVNDPSLEGKQSKKPATVVTKPVTVVTAQVPVNKTIVSDSHPQERPLNTYVYQPEIVETVHKMFRAGLFNTSKLLGSCDYQNIEKVKAAAGAVKQITGELRNHANVENKFVFPALEKRSPGSTSQLHSDHDNQEKQFAELDALADSLLSSNQDTKLKLFNLYHKFNAFVASYLVHLEEEELVFVPKIRSLFSSQEILNEITLPILKILPFEKMQKGIELLYSSINLDDKTSMAMGLKKGVSTQLFDKVLGWAQAVISPADWKELNRRLFF